MLMTAEVCDVAKLSSGCASISVHNCAGKLPGFACKTNLIIHNKHNVLCETCAVLCNKYAEWKNDTEKERKREERGENEKSGKRKAIKEKGEVGMRQKLWL